MKKKNGDWTIKGTEKKFENDFFKVMEDDVVEPDGKDGKYATIRFKPGVSVLPIDDEGNIYITRQFRYALERDNVEAVAGAIEGEGRLQAAKREVREELGIEAEDWKYMGKIECDTAITNSLCHLYLARKLKFKKSNPESSEKIKMIKMKLSTAFEKVLSGEITHPQACILILKAEKLVESE
jgi:hypothetical protein